MNEFDEDYIPNSINPSNRKKQVIQARPVHQIRQTKVLPALPNSTAILVLGIVSIVIWPTGIPCGIIALALYKKDKLLYNTQPLGSFSEQSNSAMNAGRICGLIGLCVSSFFVFIFLLYFIFVFLIFGAIFAATTH